MKTHAGFKRRSERMFDDGWKFCQKFGQFIVDFGSNRSGGVFFLIRGVPARDNVVRVDLPYVKHEYRVFYGFSD